MSVRFGLLLPLGLALAACAFEPGDKSPQAECERRAYQDPVVQSIYRGDQGDYRAVGPARSNLDQALQQSTLKCMREKGLAPPGGVEPIRPPVY